MIRICVRDVPSIQDGSTLPPQPEKVSPKRRGVSIVVSSILVLEVPGGPVKIARHFSGGWARETMRVPWARLKWRLQRDGSLPSSPQVQQSKDFMIILRTFMYV
jgi:hypothetical protein